MRRHRGGVNKKLKKIVRQRSKCVRVRFGGGRDFTGDCSAFARDASAAAGIIDERVDNESYSLWITQVI